MTTARIVWLGADRFAVYTPYSAAFVDALKDATYTRRWLPEERRWVCDGVDYAAVLRLLKRHFDRVEANVRPQAEGPRQRAHSAVTTPYDVMGVRADAPIEVIEAAYRAMVKLHHPDIHGAGATARMAAVNSAMDNIRAERGST